MHSIRISLGSLALVSFCLQAHADPAPQGCPPATVAAVARWAHVQGPLTDWQQAGGLIAAAACKAMPDAPDTTIAVIALDIHQEGPSHSDGSKLQVVALVQAQQVIAAHRSMVQEDALTAVGRYRIDTARYRLSPAVRAFGTIFHSAAPGPSCPDAAADAELTLWVHEGQQLRPVLGTNLRGWISTEGTPCAMGNATARSEEAHITIGVEKTSANCFADLSLTARITQPLQQGSDDQVTGQRTARSVLRYDGKTYGNDMFREFWYPAALQR